MIRRVLLLAAAVMTVLCTAGPAAADGVSGDGPVDAGRVFIGTPRSVTVELGSDPQGSVDVVLRRADGTVVPFTGDMVTVDGRSVDAHPPVLEPGTYVLTWTYVSRGTDLTGSTWFSVGEANASVSGVGEGRARDTAGVVALSVVAGMLAVLSGLLQLRQRRRRRSTLLAAGGLLVAAGGAALLAASPSAVVLGLCAAGAVLALRWPRLLVVAGAGAGVAAGAVVAGVSSPVLFAAASVGLGSVIVLAGVGAFVAVSPGRARVTLRRRGAWLALPVLLGPLAVAASWTSQNVQVSAALSGAGLRLLASFVAGGLAVFLAAGVVVLLSRRRGRAAASLAGTASVLLVLAGVLVAPPAAAPVVTPVTVSASGSAEECLALNNRLTTTTCLQALFSAKARTDGVVASLTALRDDVQAQPAMRFYCHEVSHAVGRASMAIHRDVATSFTDGFDVCDFGYYHGIIEGAAGDMTDEEFRQAVPNICRELATANRMFYMQCNHGLGHAAARRTNNDMVRALEFCDALATDPSLRPDEVDGALNGCGTGVTMEWFATAGAYGGADGVVASPAVDPLRDVCTVVPDRWKPECYEYVGNTVGGRSALDGLMEISTWCTSQGDFADDCVKGVARAAGGLGLGIDDVERVCAVGPANRDSCLEFFLVTVATTIDFNAAAVDRLCAQLPDRDRVGPKSVCSRAKQLSLSVLANGDGKSQS